MLLSMTAVQVCAQHQTQLQKVQTVAVQQIFLDGCGGGP